MERSNDEASAKALSDGYPRLEETLLLEILKRVQKQYSSVSLPLISPNTDISQGLQISSD